METILPLLAALKKLDQVQRGPFSRMGHREELIKAQRDWAAAGYPFPKVKLAPAKSFGEAAAELMEILGPEDFQQEMHRLTGSAPPSSGQEK